MSNASLSSRAMMAHLKISVWTASAFDKEVGEQVAADHDAVQDAGRYSKKLLDPEALKPIRAIELAARTTHRELTSPWKNDGARILPAKLYLTYRKDMKDHERHFDEELENVIRHYPEAVEARKTQLGSLFDENNYPTQEALRDKFGFDLQVYNVPDSADFRVDLGEAQIAEIQEMMEKQARDTYSTVTLDAQRRIIHCVGKLADKLKDFDPENGRFRKSMIEDVRKAAEIIPELNLADDPRINELVGRMRDEITNGIDADDIRNDSIVRADVAQAAQTLMRDAEGMFS